MQSTECFSRLGYWCRRADVVSDRRPFPFRSHQGRSDGGISVYIPQKSVYLKKFMWLFFSCDPGQIRYDMFTCGTLTYVLKLQWLVKTYTPKSNSWLRPWESQWRKDKAQGMTSAGWRQERLTNPQEPCQGVSGLTQLVRASREFF